MADITIVGSGPSGVHFAQTALDKGHHVTMIDVGRERAPQPHPDLGYQDLKDHAADAVEYFLGDDYAGVVLPSFGKEYYGLPPSKDHVFESIPGFGPRSSGFAPLFSFARGGLAEAWTGGCYPLNDAELADFGFGWDTIAPYYAEVARRIGVTGAPDDLTQFMPTHDHLLQPLALDEHSTVLMHRYGKHRTYLAGTLRCHLGRTRVATLPHDHNGRQGCTRLGRCLWGCPRESLYTPSMTLRECLLHPNFRYEPGNIARWFETDPDGNVTALACTRLDDRSPVRYPVELLVLAAGALNTSGIFLRSVFERTGERVQLTGLMDNRQILVPFLNLRMVGRQYDPVTYQYHLLGMGIERDEPREYVHGQITTLKTAMQHPIIQRLPFDLGTATYVTRHLHAALGIVNLNFHDTPRESNYVALRADDHDNVEIHYAPAPGEAQLIDDTMRRTRKALRRLGCFVPGPMTHVRPMGASVHYSGTLRMAPAGTKWSTDPFGRSRDFGNLIIADGATFPFLPAKNLTFTLMANAIRIADAIL